MNCNLERIKQIEIENFIWIIYLFLIGLCLCGNKYEKEFFLTSNPHSKEIYRRITIIIFVIALIVYIYFFIDGYNSLKELKKDDSNKKKTYTNLSFLGSTLILISGIIFLYIAINDNDLDVELAFN